MPELPEVELTMRGLAPRITGKTIVDFWTDWPRGLKSKLGLPAIKKEIRGKKVAELKRRGKVIFLMLEPGTCMFAIHLRMSGSLILGRPEKHAHFQWKFSSGEELWFVDPRKFGVVWYGTAEEMKSDPYLGTLGPDAAAISLAEFRDRTRSHRGMLKPLLLRQDIIAGLGNIIADEMLWQAKLHPTLPAKSLSEQQIRQLYFSMKKTISRILAAQGNSVRNWVMPDGQKGRSASRLKVYGKNGRPCPRCGNPIKRIVVGGRGTHTCTKCQ